MDFKTLASKVKEKVNIVNYLEEQGLSLQKDGIQRYKACCPFHTEKTPSFKVDNRTQSYRCYGCGMSGDIISYVSEIHKINLGESLIMLAEDANIDTTEFKNQEKTSEYKDLSRGYNILKQTAEYYKKCFKELPENHPAKIEVTKRNLNIEDFDCLGYAPKNNTSESLVEHLKKHYSFSELVEYGVLSQNEKKQYYDPMAGRLVFIMNSYLGKPIAFSGRDLTNTAKSKYVNTKTTPLFDKSSSFFNLDKAKTKAKNEQVVYIVEGQFDVLALMAMGHTNVVASSGTSITEKHIRELLKLVGKDGKIIFCLDGDKAGFKAMVRVFEGFPIIHSQSYIIQIDKGKDPSDLYRDNIELPQDEPMLDKLFNQCRKRLSANNFTTQTRTAFVDFTISNFLKHITNEMLLDDYIRSVASISMFPIADIKSRYQELTNKKQYTNVNNIKTEQEDKFFENLSSADKCFVRALSLYSSYPEIITIEVNSYPKKYGRILKEFVEYPKTEPFIIEKFYKPDLVKCILSFDYEYSVKKDALYIKSYYENLLQSGKDIIEKEKKDKIVATFKEKMESATPEERVALLKKFEELKER